MKSYYYYYKVLFEKCSYRSRSNHNFFFPKYNMARFGEKEIAKEKFHAAKKPIKNFDINVDNIVHWKLIERKSNSNYLIGIKFDKGIIPLVLIMLKWVDMLRHLKLKKGIIN